MNLRTILRLSSLVVPVGLAHPARADSGSLAEALFRDGRQAMRAGAYAAACPKLAESQRLDPSPGTDLNLALCEEHEQRLASAWAHYREVADQLPESDPRVRIAREHASALEPRVPRLRILAPQDAPSVKISLDGVELREASIGTLLPVDPGTHAIEARTSAGKTVLAVTLAEGETTETPVALPLPVLPEETSPPAQARAHSSAQRTGGWLVGATGAAGVVTSLVLGALVLKEKATVSSNCSPNGCNAVGLAAGRDGSMFAAAATVSFSVGVVALGGGAVLILSAPNPAASRGAGSSVSLQGSF